jgi:hypothetical protein
MTVFRFVGKVEGVANGLKAGRGEGGGYGAVWERIGNLNWGRRRRRAPFVVGRRSKGGWRWGLRWGWTRSFDGEGGVEGVAANGKSFCCRWLRLRREEGGERKVEGSTLKLNTLLLRWTGRWVTRLTQRAWPATVFGGREEGRGAFEEGIVRGRGRRRGFQGSGAGSDPWQVFAASDGAHMPSELAILALKVAGLDLDAETVLAAVDLKGSKGRGRMGGKL